MRVRQKGPLSFAAACLCVLGVAGLPALPADAASGRCAPGTGVTVVVDFGPLGGGVPVSCDPGGGGDDARAATQHVGFTLDDVRTQPGFVCAINAKPDPDQSCQRTPPADAYWGLFWSDGKSGTWNYSSEGASGLQVPEGGSVGWRWQDGGARDNPGAAPTVKRSSPSPAPSPTRTPTPKPKPTPAVGEPTQAAPTDEAPPPSSEPAGTGPASKPKPSDRGSRPGKDRSGKPTEAPTARTPSASPTDPPTETTEAAGALAPTSGEPTSSGSDPLLTGLAATAVVMLGAAAGVIGWRRRRG